MFLFFLHRHGDSCAATSERNGNYAIGSVDVSRVPNISLLKTAGTGQTLSVLFELAKSGEVGIGQLLRSHLRTKTLAK